MKKNSSRSFIHDFLFSSHQNFVPFLLDISLEIASFVKTGRRLSGYSQGGERVEKGNVNEPTYKFAVYLWIFFQKLII
jgi:hypothetical protein